MIRKKIWILLCCLTLPAVATATGPARAAAEDALLPVGAVAPAVEGKDASGALVRLSAQKGHFAVVYFYPKDETVGCTKEACAFRDASDQFAAAGVTVFGVSRDPESSHQAFREKHALKFPLVADPTGAVQRAYHVPAVAPGAAVAARVTFLVGPDGKIARVWPKVDPVVNATEVLGAVAALGGKGPAGGSASAKDKDKKSP